LVQIGAGHPLAEPACPAKAGCRQAEVESLVPTIPPFYWSFDQSITRPVFLVGDNTDKGRNRNSHI